MAKKAMYATSAQTSVEYNDTFGKHHSTKLLLVDWNSDDGRNNPPLRKMYLLMGKQILRKSGLLDSLLEGQETCAEKACGRAKLRAEDIRLVFF